MNKPEIEEFHSQPKIKRMIERKNKIRFALTLVAWVGCVGSPFIMFYGMFYEIQYVHIIGWVLFAVSALCDLARAPYIINHNKKYNKLYRGYFYKKQ